MYFMEHKRPNYVHISTLYRRTTFMLMCQAVNSDRFLETLFCSFPSLLRFGSLNTLLTLPVEKDCVGKAKPCSLDETGDIILLNES